MSCFRRVIVGTLLISQPCIVYGQTIVVGNSTVSANESTVAPAVAIVDAKESNSTANLFDGETQQLTDAVIANLTDLELSNIALFSFQNESSLNETLAKRTVPGICKTYPDDPFWPFSSTWHLFDILLGGGLIKTVPYASSCYSSFKDYNSTKCEFITNNWINASIYHTEDPTSINAVLFQGSTCMPPALMPAQSECTVGGYPEYAVSVRNVAQIQLAINFARNLNLRVVIKNTGHDFSAKSVGMGALSIWTHNLKQIQFLRNYRQGSYRGPAFKLGSGVQAFEAYEAARKNNVTIVGGEGRTVGVMGGFLLGGGHSPLSSLYGMAADQVLSMEVVTSDGRFVTANEISHPSLFWALRGGGGSTFGVVTSVVVKAYPKIKVTTLTYILATGPTISYTQFWAAMRAFFDGFITYTDAGNYEYFRISKLGEGRYFSDMGPWFAPGMNKTQLQTLVAPLFSRFKELGVEVKPVYKEYDDFYDAWYASFPVEPWGSNAIRQASRLFPKSNWEDAAKLNATFDVIKSVVEEGGYIVAFNIAAAPKTGYPDNAVNPAWRNTVMHAIMATLWNTTSSEAEMKAASDRLTYGWMQRWRDVSPGAGAYMSEADYIEPDFTQAFFGDNYARLYRIKQFYDPFGVFYAHTAVGSEDWKMSKMILGNLPSQNSKLCRKT
ncbi:FAD-binding domain-containing protein [Annulohypoxylon maeteangense]|uniref:FAD-binding domain-containing protein n=1 Tax=Annulohypoxylon maeteangense TaxID=1927788 RepID=UPI00200779F5|nr:FAD-binding domain-containing protein [Annulohypoxylon maeteangense]KAI0883298.1 FAD-binding domain-containing protein [Annulohypoxylon maeteangense]